MRTQRQPDRMSPVGRGTWRSSLAALLVTDVVFGFQQTGITPALPAVQRDLGASQAWTAWVLSGYLIVGSISPPLLGKLTDRVGKRRVFVTALGVFLAGSVGATFATDIGVLVACRALQGVLRRTGGGIGAQASVVLLGVGGAAGGAAFTIAFLAAAGAAVLGAAAALLTTP